MYIDIYTFNEIWHISIHIWKGTCRLLLFRISGHVYTCTAMYYRLTHKQIDYVTCVTNLGGNMARFTQFPLMITRSTIIYEIISPGAAGSSIYV